MEGLYFLAAILVFLLIVYWAWRNDEPVPGRRTTGLLRMRELSGEGDETPAPGPLPPESGRARGA